MRVIGSHTSGEPIRLIVERGPDLGTGPLSEQGMRSAGAACVQETGVIGTRLASDEAGRDRTVLPRITGRACVTAKTTRPRDLFDPLVNGTGDHG